MSSQENARIGAVLRHPVVAVLVSAFASVILFMVSTGQTTEWKLGLALVLLTSSLTLLLRLTWIEATSREIYTYQIYTTQTPALRAAQDLMRGGSRIKAMWTSMGYSSELRDYFRANLGVSGSVTTRIIDLSIPITDIVDHLQGAWPNLVNGTYKVSFVQSLHFELLLVDDSKAGIFLPAGPGYGFMVITGEGGRLASCVRGMFGRVEDVATPLLPNDFPEEFDSAAVTSWLTGLRAGATQKQKEVRAD